MFKDIPPVELRAYLQGASTALVRAGQRVFAEGDNGEDAIFVTRGLVSLSKAVPHGRRVTVELVGSGEPLGVLAVLERRPYPLEAVTFIETGLLHIPFPEFHALTQRYPGILTELYRVVGTRFRRAQGRIAELVSAGARARVIAAIELLLDRPEVCKMGNTVTSSRRQLAELAGVTTETCIRMTTALEEESILSFPGRKCIRVDRDRLGAASAVDK